LQAIFTLQTAKACPIIVVFTAFFNEKTVKTYTYNRLLDFLGNDVALKTAGADLQGKRSPPNLGLYFNQIRLPDPPGPVLGMTHLVAGNRMFSANITGP
jgi:hypothetical protein